MAMSKQGKKGIPDKQPKKKQNLSLIWSMLFFVLAVVGFLGMLHPLNLQPFDYFNDIMKYMLGRWHILLPFVFLVISMRVLLGIKLVRLNTSFVAFIIFSICGPALFHHIRIPLQQELVPTNLIHGGGLWGGLIALVLHKLVGNYATFFILASGCLLAIGLLVPWGELLSSKKRDEEYEEFLKETEKINEIEEQKKNVKNARRSSADKKLPLAVKTADVSVSSAEVHKQNVYQDDEFSSFTEGIRPESTFKKILNIGKKDTTYTQEDIKEQLEKDPIQIPEWEQEEKTSVVIRPVISYGDERVTVTKPQKVESEKKETTGVVKTEQVTTAESEIKVKPYESIITNPYHKVKDDSEVQTSAVTEDTLPRAEDIDFRNVDPDLYSESLFNEDKNKESKAEETSFVIHKRVDDTEVNKMNEKTEEAGYNPAFDGYVEAAATLNKRALAEQGLVGRKQQIAKDSTSKEEENTISEPKKPEYIFPPYELLAAPKKKDSAAGNAEIMQQCSVLEQTLADFRVKAKVVAATRGPAVTQFELQPAPGVKVNSVVNLSDDIALRLAAPGVRIEAPIPGKSAIGIEVPNLQTDPVSFREVVDSDIVRKKESKLCIGLGKDISGNTITADIAKMPHLLIAGSTGSGKSVCINTIICGILYKALPEEVKLILVDPKVVELSIYDGIPHLLTPVVTEPKKAASALHWGVAEMERRYKLFADNHVRNIEGYNKVAQEKLPYIVIIIDEMADLMVTVKADIETAIMRLAAKARAAGIHMILATQRPSVDVITGVLKNNIPSRIAFAVTSLIDSRTILDAAGAEKLLGKGDMLFSPYGSTKPTRVQGAFVSDEEVGKIVEFIIGQSIPVEYSDEVTSVELESDKKANTAGGEEESVNPDPTDDPLFEKALMLVLDTGQASASMMQRRFSIGYNRAARLVDTMAELGIVGKSMGSKPREVIMSRQEAEERFLNKE